LPFCLVHEKEITMPNPQPLPPVTVFVDSETLFDIKKMQKVTATALGKLGCPGCHSGRDIRFVELNQFIVNPKTLELNEFMGGGIG
jgi:hypothetical protein